MYPDVDGSNCQKRVEARGHTLPTDHQAAVFLLEPGKCALGLEPLDHVFDWSPSVFLGLPDSLRDLRPYPSLPELLPQRFRLIALIGGKDFEAFAGATTFSGADLHGIKQRQHLCPLVPLGRRGPVGQGHAAPLGEAVDEDPLALPPVRDALAAPLPRGNKRHPRRHTPNESSHVPQQSPESGLASRPGCHPPATAATSDAWRSSTPIAAHTGHRTSDSR